MGGAGADTVTIDGVFTSRVLSMNLTDGIAFFFHSHLWPGTTISCRLTAQLRYSIDCLKSQALNAARHLIAREVKYGIPACRPCIPVRVMLTSGLLNSKWSFLPGWARTGPDYELSETVSMQLTNRLRHFFRQRRISTRVVMPGTNVPVVAMFDPMLWRKARKKTFEG